MTTHKQVPKSLVFKAQPLEDTELISPESLFEGFDQNQPDIILSSPDELFSQIDTKEIKLKSPDELFGKINKNKSNDKNQENKNRKPN